MKDRKTNSFLFVLSVIFLLVLTVSISHAQQGTTKSQDDQIPSDLSLDLKLAQDSPDPDQKTILASETRQAKLVTDKGEVTNLKPRDEVATQVKTESATDAEHPEQTSSEQVVSTPVTVEEKVSPNGSTVQPGTSTENPGSSTGSLVPGTTVAEPDDNAVAAPTPGDNSQTPSSLTPLENQPSGTNDNSQQPNQTPAGGPDNSGNSNLPPESNPPTSTAPDNGSSSTPPPPPPPPPPEDNSAVQGVSTGPMDFFQRIINFFRGRE